jgi:predicted Zn-dependent peptidase
MEMIKELILGNKLTLVYEQLPHLRSVAFGVWIGTGSRYENHEINGISHFIEHMVFKGTKRRSAKDIAQEIDGLGGQINAFTGKECTCFYTKTLEKDLDLSMDILSDMLFGSLFAKEHIETEKKVVLEEIGMYEDYPEDMVSDILTEKIWGGNSLGFPILGTGHTVASFNAVNMNTYMTNHYTPDNCVISVAGNFDENRLIEGVNHYFGKWENTGLKSKSMEIPQFRTLKKKETEQVHMCLGFHGIKISDDDTWPLMVFNNVLGGGMSSRLFQSIREELGLAYSIYSFPTSYIDSGLFSIYAATSPQSAKQVLDLIGTEIELLLAKGMSENELERSKNQLKGSYLLSLDSTSGRMTGNGKSKIILDEIKTTEEIIEAIDRISLTAIDRVIKDIFKRSDAGLAVIGDIEMKESALDSFMF